MYSETEIIVGFTMPIPPSHICRASKACSMSLKALFPVKAGRNLYLLTSSRG